MIAINRGVAVLLMVALLSCSETGEQEGSEPLTDSVIGQSQLPGAQGVRGALAASDSAAARRARLDSLAQQE